MMKRVHTNTNIRYLRQTLFNQLSNGCTVALPLVFLVTVSSVALAIKEHRRSSVDSPGSI